MDKLLEINMLIFYILAGIPIFILIFFLLKNKSLKIKMIFLTIIWAAGLLLLIINKTAHYLRGEHILAQMPLHLCYFALIFFIPMALFTKKKIYYDFIFYINSLGALMALFFPARDYVDGIWSVITFTYVVFHYIIVCIPLFLFMWKIYSPKIKLAGALKITAILILLSLAMHGLNLILVNNGVAAANYCWTLVANARYNVRILRLIASIIPYDYVYLAAFAAPCLALYIGLWGIGFLINDKRKNRRASD